MLTDIQKRFLSHETILSNDETTDEKPESSTKISLRRSKQFKIGKENDDDLTQNTLTQQSAMDRAELESTINDILTAMNMDTSGSPNRYLAMLSSMTRLAGFFSVFVQLNGIETLVSLKSRAMEEYLNEPFFVLVLGISFHCSEAADLLLTSPISNDLIALLQTSDIGTTELILKTLINLGVDNIDMFRSQLGTKLLQSICPLLQKSLPIHYQHLFVRDGVVFFGESPQDMSTELCLKILILIVERSKQFRLGNEFVGLVAPLLRHKSTTIVLLALATLHTMISYRAFAETIKTTILVAQVDGETQPIPMIRLVTELFGDYLSRLRAQIEQIQWLWTNESESAMLLDRYSGIDGTGASEDLDVVTLTPQISATCEVLGDLSQLFGSAVFWEKQLHETVLDCGMLCLFGDYFSFVHKYLECEDSLKRLNPAVELSWMDSRTTVKEDATRVVRSCLVGIAEVFERSRDRNDRVFSAIYRQHRKPNKTFFSVLSALLALGVPHLTQPVTRIVKTILKWRDTSFLKVLKSGLIKVLIQDVTTQDIDNELSEKTLMQIANRVLARGRLYCSEYSKPPKVDRDCALHLHSLLAESKFVETMENRSQKRTEAWTEELVTLRELCSEFEDLMTSSGNMSL
ncbi:hypothetical protein BLNAU_7755 [Blattamonas nauphoetae]|uniref:Uncharacterized protein n=1 Tax=Blattamonas nauphoetae TaxID=2049346 RepID=A0ABQ9Y0V9_9EUKA|nr:hypothetical protein BLNAU_7755 [Blattamonas nauphoetae]